MPIELDSNREINYAPILSDASVQRGESVKNVALPIFHAKSSPKIDYTWQDRLKNSAFFLAKWLFFPISVPVSLFLKSFAASMAIANKNAKIVNKMLLQELQNLGGEPIQFQTEDDISLKGMNFKTKVANPSGKTILVCSGSHFSNEKYNIPIVEAFLEMGHNVMTFNYRGFGESEGNPSEDGMYKDGEAAYQYLRSQDLNDKDIVLYGYSLGAGVTTDIAAKHPLDLILDRAFSSGPNKAAKVVSKKITWLARLIAFTGSNFNNADKLKYVKGKVFIAQELGAESFLERMAKALSRARKQPISSLEKSNVVLAQLQVLHLHNDFNLWFGKYDHSENKQKLVNFFKTL